MGVLSAVVLTAWLVFWPRPGNTWPRGATALVAVFCVLVFAPPSLVFCVALLFLTMVPCVSTLHLIVASFILYEALLGDNAGMLFRLNTLLCLPFGLLLPVQALVGWRRTPAKYFTDGVTTSGS